jgi:hypothetical protein
VRAFFYLVHVFLAFSGSFAGEWQRPAKKTGAGFRPDALPAVLRNGGDGQRRDAFRHLLIPNSGCTRHHFVKPVRIASGCAFAGDGGVYRAILCLQAKHVIDSPKGEAVRQNNITGSHRAQYNKFRF